MSSETYASPAVIAPVLGVLLSVSRSLVPVREVVAVRKQRRLGELNPGPFAATILNNVGWLVYAVLHTDWFIFVMETAGLLCSVWITLSLYPLASLKVQNRLNAFVLLAVVLYCSLSMVTMILNMTALEHASTLLWNWAVSITQILLCASPLSTLYKALVQKSSASFHLGFIILNTLSSAMWMIYGLTQKSLFLAVPNALGTALSVTALLVCVLFPRKIPETSEDQWQENALRLEQSVQLP